MLIGMLVAAIINFVPYVLTSARLIELKTIKQLRVNALPFLISMLTAIIVTTVDQFLLFELSPFPRLIIQTIIFMTVLLIQGFLFRPFPISNELAIWRNRT